MRAPAYISASGKSSLTPPPPWTWIARSMTSQAIRGAITLIAATSVRAPLAPTVSISQAVFSVISRACSIAIRDSAICCLHHALLAPAPCRTPPATPPGWHISSSARSAMPTARMQ